MSCVHGAILVAGPRKGHMEFGHTCTAPSHGTCPVFFSLSMGQTAPFPLFGVGQVSLARSPSPLGRSVVVSLIEREEKTVPFT